MTVEFHESANIFPLDEEHLEDLAADIKTNGLQVPIETLDGKIIDGRRRYLACEKAGVKPQFRAIQTSDPVAYVVSLNLHRRHLSESQVSMVVARATAMQEKYSKQAEERMQAGKGSDGSGGRGNKKNPSAARREGLATPEEPMRTSEQMGNLFGVGARTVERAKRVLNNAVPEVIQAVDEGRMSVNKAEILCTKDEEVQRTEAAKPKNGRKPTEEEKEEESEEEETDTNGKPKGVGVRLAHEALNCLIRIPKNDALRKRGFQIVTDWIRHNK